MSYSAIKRKGVQKGKKRGRKPYVRTKCLHSELDGTSLCKSCCRYVLTCTACSKRIFRESVSKYRHPEHRSIPLCGYCYGVTYPSLVISPKKMETSSSDDEFFPSAAEKKSALVKRNLASKERKSDRETEMETEEEESEEKSDSIEMKKMKKGAKESTEKKANTCYDCFPTLDQKFMQQATTMKAKASSSSSSSSTSGSAAPSMPPMPIVMSHIRRAVQEPPSTCPPDCQVCIAAKSVESQMAPLQAPLQTTAPLQTPTAYAAENTQKTFMCMPNCTICPLVQPTLPVPLPGPYTPSYQYSLPTQYVPPVPYTFSSQSYVQQQSQQSQQQPTQAPQQTDSNPPTDYDQFMGYNSPLHDEPTYASLFDWTDPDLPTTEEENAFANSFLN